MDALLRRVEALERNAAEGNAEREHLREKIAELEEQLEDLKETVKHLGVDYVDKASIRLNNRYKRTNAEDDEPWLFYTGIGTPTEVIRRLLGFTESSAIELPISELVIEEELWRQLLTRFYQDPRGLPSKLSDLRQLAGVELSLACHQELLIILRGLPPSSSPLFKAVLPQVVTLAEYVNIAWSEVENTNPDLLGRLAVILETGEELRELSVERAKSRVSLYVEKLVRTR
mmetsp:Transcript_5208/g.9569  ORF Transcript_5208/g.9569 Transcript_5208/m.9569 type:complete len:230 (+) Transcript_5208:281-970(+)